MAFLVINYINYYCAGFKVGEYLSHSYHNAPVDEHYYHWRYGYYNGINGKLKGAGRVRFFRVPDNLTINDLSKLKELRYSQLAEIKKVLKIN